MGAFCIELNAFTTGGPFGGTTYLDLVYGGVLGLYGGSSVYTFQIFSHDVREHSSSTHKTVTRRTKEAMTPSRDKKQDKYCTRGGEISLLLWRPRDVYRQWNKKGEDGSQGAKGKPSVFYGTLNVGNGATRRRVSAEGYK